MVRKRQKEKEKGKEAKARRGREGEGGEEADRKRPRKVGSYEDPPSLSPSPSEQCLETVRRPGLGKEGQGRQDLMMQSPGPSQAQAIAQELPSPSRPPVAPQPGFMGFQGASLQAALQPSPQGSPSSRLQTTPGQPTVIIRRMLLGQPRPAPPTRTSPALDLIPGNQDRASQFRGATLHLGAKCDQVKNKRDNPRTKPVIMAIIMWNNEGMRLKMTSPIWENVVRATEYCMQALGKPGTLAADTTTNEEQGMVIAFADWQESLLHQLIRCSHEPWRFDLFSAEGPQQVPTRDPDRTNGMLLDIEAHAKRICLTLSQQEAKQVLEMTKQSMCYAMDGASESWIKFQGFHDSFAQMSYEEKQKLTFMRPAVGSTWLRRALHPTSSNGVKIIRTNQGQLEGLVAAQSSLALTLLHSDIGRSHSMISTMYAYRTRLYCTVHIQFTSTA